MELVDQVLPTCVLETLKRRTGGSAAVEGEVLGEASAQTFILPARQPRTPPYPETGERERNVHVKYIYAFHI